MSSPTLMFCVGATKAGTSWLHRFLAGHPDCHLRGVKELHYFDAVEFDDWDQWVGDAKRRCDRQRRELAEAGADQATQKQRGLDDAEDWRALLAVRRPDEAAYLAYLDKGRTDQTLVADMTPAYGLLPERRLRAMAGLAADVRFVYLLRDPVDRIWSHARMMAHRRSDAGADIAPQAAKIANRILSGKEPEIVRRSDYIGPVTRLRAAVDPARLFFGFYEELFSRPAIAALCRFLGIAPKDADFSHRVMEGPPAELGARQWDDLRSFLSPQYDAMREMFGTLPQAWGGRTMKV